MTFDNIDANCRRARGLWCAPRIFRNVPKCGRSCRGARIIDIFESREAFEVFAANRAPVYEEAVRGLAERLGMTDYDNVNYPRAIRRVLGLEPWPNEVALG